MLARCMRVAILLAIAISIAHARDSSPAALRTTRQSAERVPPPLLVLRGGDTMASWRAWAYKALAKMGIFLKKGKLLVLGLDNAGKSTLLTVLKQNEVVPTAPTHQPVTDEIKVGHLKLRAVDMGGHEIARRMWLQYSHEADGVVYIVDACDRERFMEAALELHKLLAASALPPHCAVLILGNKGDLPHSATQEELYWGLGLDELFKKVCRDLHPLCGADATGDHQRQRVLCFLIPANPITHPPRLSTHGLVPPSPLHPRALRRPSPHRASGRLGSSCARCSSAEDTWKVRCGLCGPPSLFCACLCLAVPHKMLVRTYLVHGARVAGFDWLAQHIK